jgi:NO-binding membrane sensor protein with MHYT domain
MNTLSDPNFIGFLGFAIGFFILALCVPVSAQAFEITNLKEGKWKWFGMSIMWFIGMVGFLVASSVQVFDNTLPFSIITGMMSVGFFFLFIYAWFQE